MAKAWAEINADTPTLADAGRMFSAYGSDFTLAELRYIARHQEALRLARNVAAGRQYLDFNESTGFSAESTFVPPEPGSARQLIAPIAMTVLGFIIIVVALLANNFKGAAIMGGLTALSAMVTLAEFAEVRNRHWARRAIEQSLSAHQLTLSAAGLVSSPIPDSVCTEGATQSG
ncbi:hypothetical protein PI87_20535 [Ralstonia sp. A12]|nr:hypothetical protein PI87_20535 [Ralstonia sp. A12]